MEIKINNLDLANITEVSVMPDGNLIKKLNTEVIPFVTLEKSKMGGLISSLYIIGVQFNLKLSEKKDRDKAFQILKKLIQSN
jgi:hypothetical protein